MTFLENSSFENNGVFHHRDARIIDFSGQVEVTQMQGTLTDWEGSVPSTSMFSLEFCIKLTNYCIFKRKYLLCVQLFLISDASLVRR
jgi:hypothetical protein